MAIPNLETLELDETLLTYDGGLKQLKIEDAEGTCVQGHEISDEDITKLKAALPKVNILWTHPKPEMLEKCTAEMAKEKSSSRADKMSAYQKCYFTLLSEMYSSRPFNSSGVIFSSGFGMMD